MTKKKPGKHLKFYMDCMENGKMPHCGLCIAAEEGIISETLLRLFEPSVELNLFRKNIYLVFWASGSYKALAWKFTELRQTIVLLMACQNNEL